MTTGWHEWLLSQWDDYAETRLGPGIAFDARRMAPRRTGELAASIEDHMTGHTLIVHAHAPYAAWVELGTRPHIIMPHARVRGGWTGPYTPGMTGAGSHSLRWFGGDGEPIFASIVHHPGTRAQPFLREALAANLNM